MMSIEEWERYKKYLNFNPEIGLMVDISRMMFPNNYFDRMEPLMQKAFQDMEAIESGAIANPDEKRMVGHYWLRAPELAPRRKMTRVVSDALKTSKDPISPLSLKKYPILFSIPDRRMKNFFQIQFKLACVG